MKSSTLLIAFGPAVLMLGLKFALEPEWLKEWGLLQCVALGAVIGALGALAARTIEPE